MHRHLNISHKAVDYMSGKLAAHRKAEEMIKKTTKSRVLKKFARKVGINIGLPILFMSTWLGVTVLMTFFGVPDNTAITITSIVFVVIPFLGLALKHMYTESKAEIERENRDLMRDLTDGYTK